MRPRRILFIDHTASLGGGELALLDLVKHLDRSRYEPVVLLFSEGPLAERLRLAEIETHVLPLSSSVAETRKDSLSAKSLVQWKEIRQILSFLRLLVRLVRNHHVDLVHTNSLKSDILGGIAARMARKPLVWHVRDRIEDDYLPRPVVKLFRLLCRVIPHCVIANSQYTLSTLHLHGRKKSIVVYSGLDLQTQCVPTSREPLSYGRPPIVGMVGRISPWKGQHIFLQAAATVLPEVPEAKFQIIGSALFDERAYERDLHTLCDKLGLEGSVEFLGFREDVPALIAEMDILAHCSTMGEPFGQVLVQGMGAGKPVVATRGGGVLEVIEEGLTGLLVPMNDAESAAGAILRLLKEPDWAREMGRRGRQRVLDHFTIEKTAQQVQSVYDGVLAAKDCSA
jgi:glycosyltransferase involved in cell wall biosynthesis